MEEAPRDGAHRPRLRVIALGCRVARSDLDAAAAALGPCRAAVEGEPADLVLVGTCAVTADAESSARQALRRAVRENPGARVVALGCLADLRPGSLTAISGVTEVRGSRALAALGSADRLAPARPIRHTRAVLKVQDGCDASCSYCTVPLARGRGRSLPFEEALAALAELGRSGPEVVLAGVHLGSYGRDLRPAANLEALVLEAARRGLVTRLRLSSVEPLELPTALLRGEARQLLCGHFHLPVQSGSAAVLAAMGRPAGPDAVERAISEIAAAAPESYLGADLIAGFPGETEADHEATLRFVERSPLGYLHVFPFSARPGTRAAALPDRVPGDVARRRAGELRALSRVREARFASSRLGRELEVVVERVEGGTARGTTREGLSLAWPAAGEVRGQLVKVRAAEVRGEVELAGVRNPAG